MENAIDGEVVPKEDVKNMIAEIDNYILDNKFSLYNRNAIIAIATKYCGDVEDGE
jgi:hypothetical protein